MARLQYSVFVLFLPVVCTHAFSLDVLSLTTNAAAAISAGAEVLEDFEHVGHGHGLLLLTGSRLCREMNVFRESMADESGELKQMSGLKKSVKKPISMFLHIITNHLFVKLLSIGALLAAWVEVVEDARPGGHHGGVLLALNELIELREEAGSKAFISFIRKPAFRLALVSGAVVMALWETISASMTKKSLGAHHGVLFLGIAKTLRCVGLVRKDRDEVKEKKEE
ncbi:MAG: hypothetical protein SGILL_006012 [Bacillariaceae sp.]